MSEERKPEMTWAAIFQLVLQYGLPVALDLADKWTRNEPVTAEDIAKLRALAEDNARSVLMARLTAAGIALDSPQGQALLLLTPPMLPRP
jgi:hypothetical protein